MSETNPYIRLQIGERSVELRRDNSTLFTFIGELACHNHVFIANDEQDEDVTLGTYLFPMIDEFPRIAHYMLTNEYPAHINMSEVAQCDRDAYDRVIESMVADTDAVPEGWV